MKSVETQHTITLTQREANLILSALYNARSEMVRIASQSHDMPKCRENAFNTYRDYQNLIDDFIHETEAEA